MTISPLSPTPATDPGAAPKTAAPGKELSMFAEKDGPSFWDFLDVINPLQHIPIINTLYREITGDQIGVGARLAGGTLFGGPVGLIASFINCAIENSTGADVGQHVLALLKDENGTPAEANPPVAVAEAPAEPPAGDLIAEARPEPAQASFSLSETGSDFVAYVPPAQVAAAPQAPPPQADPGQLQAQPVVLAGRFMPVPNRIPASSMKAAPPISVPISVSGQRSNVPITGHNPLSMANAGPNPMAVQKALAQQGLGGATHPALPDGKAGDWFSSSMSQALDKYERNSRLGRPSGATLAQP